MEQRYRAVFSLAAVRFAPFLAAGAVILDGRRCLPIAVGCCMLAVTVIIKHVESIRALEQAGQTEDTLTSGREAREKSQPL